MVLTFRDLRADEIDCRVATVKENGASLLLYKDARCDMNILDETVGAFNWQRSHSRENANCTVSIWDEDKSQWISKEDTGTESNTEAQKGLASDSFKRACFNWGIGRELYTAPFIWVKADCYNVSTKNGKPTTYDKFCVTDITIKEKKIVALEITNVTTGKVAYKMGKVSGGKTAQAKKAEPENTTEPPFEVVLYRDQFRKFVADNKLSNGQINQILTACNLKVDSPDSEWENGLMYAISLIGGVQ